MYQPAMWNAFDIWCCILNLKPIECIQAFFFPDMMCVLLINILRRILLKCRSLNNLQFVASFYQHMVVQRRVCFFGPYSLFIVLSAVLGVHISLLFIFFTNTLMFKFIWFWSYLLKLNVPVCEIPYLFLFLRYQDYTVSLGIPMGLKC